MLEFHRGDILCDVTADRSIALQRTIVWAATAALLVVGLLTTVAPSPHPPEGPAEFSIDNAMGHVRSIAAEPHPVGSAADARVREYLLDQLKKLGLEPEVQTANVLGRTVQNVIARVPGSQSAIRNRQSAILLVAHYDSVMYGPGAGDDSAAVGALLETARCLRAGPPLKRDLILLLTDGEEAGLLGARAFCADESFAFKENRVRALPPDTRSASPLALHPAFDEVAVVLNFDARGASGPAIMFETGAGNLALIRHFAAAAPRPIANSLSYDVYKMLRNDTDFTVFRRGSRD